jgi:hypothetical protein
LADRRLLLRLSSTTFAAAAIAASVLRRSPRSISNTRLLSKRACTSGAPSATASRGVVTAGNGSYATSTASAASSAANFVSATTAATMSPTWWTLSRAKAGRGAAFMGRPSPNGIGCTIVSSPCPALAQSSAVNISNTPGRAAATRVDNELIRAWACGLRTKAHQASPGSTTSST